jgi:dihydroorotate dehydrogenase
MAFALLKKILFKLDPESAHGVALKGLQLAHRLGLSKFFPSPPRSQHELMGLSFPNAVGLAAGFDKNGDYIDALAMLGFGFIEIGTITPRPQEGNPRPRLFRLTPEEAIINRLGFNNKGVEHLVKAVQKISFRGILGINIGKNRDTPLEKAVDDYLYCWRRVAPYASYITLNISSPNTPELRNLQHGNHLSSLLYSLKKEQALFAATQQKYVPLVVKLAPDLTVEELERIAEQLLAEKIDGVIATNTTLSREEILSSPYAAQAGGLSGKPLSQRSTTVIKNLYRCLEDKIPIIASGGIVSEQDALEKITAGARLVQVYTGLIYQDPWWIARLAKKLG